MRALFILALSASAVAGCGGNGIGRKCINATGDGGIKGTALSSPALECPTRLCLLQGDPTTGALTRSTCTVECVTDADCADATTTKTMGDGLCASTFACAVVTTVGPFKCKKMCICKTDLKCGENADNDLKPVTPRACDPNAVTPTCTGGS